MKVKIETYDANNNRVYKEIEGEFIEPIQLQVVCQRWWREIITGINKENKQEALHADGLDRVEVALEALYMDAIHKVIKETRVSEKAIRKWVEEKLITANGGRAVVLKGETFTEGLPNQAVDILDKYHFIRPEIRSGAIFYELAYDRLIDPIKNSNFKWKAKKSSLFGSVFK
jgi:hypothetical protein